MGFDVLPGTRSSLEKKWLAITSFGSIQGRPLTLTAVVIKHGIGQVKTTSTSTTYFVRKINNLIRSQPELVGSATQKSCNGLGSEAVAEAQMMARKLAITNKMWLAISIA
jgi:hypothetical protein